MSELLPRVLLVNDDPAMRQLLAAWLERAGYCVDRAADGREALAAIERECPDYLITDWEMPYINGLELCRRVRGLALPHYVYIFFVTAKSESGKLIEGLNVGADDFLCKPLLQGELLARLRAGARVLNLERRLSQLVRTDSLTGLMTRHAFFEVLAKEWHRASRTLAPLACVMMDLDLFKRINDTFGHLAGDAALRTTGRDLAGQLPRAATAPAATAAKSSASSSRKPTSRKRPSGRSGSAAAWPRRRSSSAARKSTSPPVSAPPSVTQTPPPPSNWSTWPTRPCSARSSRGGTA